MLWHNNWLCLIRFFDRIMHKLYKNYKQNNINLIFITIYNSILFLRRMIWVFNWLFDWMWCLWCSYKWLILLNILRMLLRLLRNYRLVRNLSNYLFLVWFELLKIRQRLVFNLCNKTILSRLSHLSIII